jgi:hypothetical protein
VVALGTAQVAGFTTANTSALTTAQIVALETADLAALTTANVQALSTAQVFALTTAQVIVLTTAQVAGLSTASVQALSTSQAAALTTAQVESLTDSQVDSLTTSQVVVMDFSTPIVLDLNGDGVRTLAIAAGVRFDLLSTGEPVSTGWVSQGDGLLVLDRNHDGSINNGSELFGSSTVLADGSKAHDGYAALAELDTNRDGVISSADAAFSGLRVWTDGNSDGVSGAGELKSLDALGITQISLTTSTGTAVDNGNVLGLVSSYQTSDGANHAAADVWFAVQSPVAASLGAKVSELSQAIGAFVDIGASSAMSANGLAASMPQSVPTMLAVAGLVDAMRQFDAHGRPVNQTSAASLAVQPLAGLASTQAAQLADVDLRAKADIPTSPSFAVLAVPK